VEVVGADRGDADQQYREPSGVSLLSEVRSLRCLGPTSDLAWPAVRRSRNMV
jgi:hypothetical protein